MEPVSRQQESALGLAEPRAVRPGDAAGTDAPTTGGGHEQTLVRSVAADAKRLVVIGNGMVGHRFCKAIAEADPEGHWAVTVIGAEPRPAYDRVNLTDFFEGKSEDDLLLAGRDWYAKRSIDLVTADPVTRIDREQQRVVAASGQVFGYDRLVLATGARPYVPEVPGHDLPGVHVYRTVEDVQAIRKAGRSAKTAVVIGGGLLGLEAARALQAMGVETAVCERSAGLMARQLDAASAGILRRQVESLGIRVKLLYRLEQISELDASNGQTRALRLHFEDGKEPIDADLVVFAVGIRSRDELASEAGLDVAGVDRGIAVNDGLETSDPSISAIGECARHRGIVYGLVAPGYEMADTVAARLTGDPDRSFVGGDLSCRLKLLGVTVGVFGDFQAECRSVTRHEAESRRSLLIVGRRLVGATVIGEWDQMGRLQEAIEAGRYVSTRQINRFHRTGDLWRWESVPLPVMQWPDGRLVCNCLKLSRGELSNAIESGALTCAQLQESTGAGTVCGSCLPLLQEMTESPAGVSGVRPVRGRKVVLIASAVAAVLVVLAVLVKPAPIPEHFSVEGGWYQLEKFWRQDLIKQVTGFTLLGLAVVGMVLSLRKRVKWLARLGDYGWYRAFHTLLGVLCLVGLIVHTGVRMGDNLNFALMCVFLALNFLGAVAGVATALEARGSGAWALRARRWRPVLTWAHLVLFWPLPVLVAFHIAVAYLY